MIALAANTTANDNIAARQSDEPTEYYMPVIQAKQIGRGNSKKRGDL